MQTILIKCGGSAMDDPAVRGRVAGELVALANTGVQIVVVHGGGKEITRWMNRLGLEARFVNGLRFTDADAMTVIEMVLSGTMNAEIVGQIGHAGGKAVGLSGKDCSLFTTKRITARGDLGLVGEVAQVDPAVIRVLLSNNMIPVISPVGATADGTTLNCNADTVAAALAAALDVHALIYLTDVDGVRKGGSIIPSLSREAGEALLSDPEITGGMIPKVECALAALRSGVHTVKILNGARPNAVRNAMDPDLGTTFQL